MLKRSSADAALLRPRCKAHPCLFARAPVGGMAALGLAALCAVTGLRSALPGVLGCPGSVRCVLGCSFLGVYVYVIYICRSCGFPCVCVLCSAGVREAGGMPSSVMFVCTLIQKKIRRRNQKIESLGNPWATDVMTSWKSCATPAVVCSELFLLRPSASLLLWRWTTRHHIMVGSMLHLFRVLRFDRCLSEMYFARHRTSLR